MLLLSLFVYSDLKKKENFLQKLLQTSAPCPQCLRSWIVIYIHIYEGVHLTLSPDIFFRRRKVWNMLHQGSVGASSEQNKRNLTLILNLLLASIVFHNTICVFIIIFTALSFFMAYSKLIFYMGGRGVMSVRLYDILVYWYIIIYTYLNLSTSICAKNIDCLVSYWGFCPNFVFKIMKKNTLLHFLVLIWCVCVCLCVCVCVYVHPPWRLYLSESVGIPGNRLTMLCWRRLFPMLSPITSHFIAFAHWKRANPRLN